MRLTFLGTGTSQGVPMIACDCEVCRSTDSRDKRLRTSALVEVDGVNMMIDAGPDFRYQLLRENIKRVDAILLTHEHKDHTGGLDDVRAFNYFLQRPMDIYAEERVLDNLRWEYPYAFSKHKYPGAPEMELHPITGKPFKVSEVGVTPIRAMHYKLPIYGFKVGGLVYVTDANHIAEESKELMKGCEILVINALRYEEHLSHFTVPEALELVKELQPRMAYFTHMSHQVGLHNDVQKTLPENVFLAYDGLKVEN
ncbi:MAG: MBL fold metallo-hydrolase [Prevotellaceae bacterium]|nr:MBL fold metallo-hydrolase [Prevotellaceae bacterium]